METRKSLFTNPLVVVALGCVMAFAAACGDDDDSGGNPTPSGGSKANTGGTNSTAGKDGGGGSSAGKSNNTAGKTQEEVGGGGAGSDTMTGEAGAGGAGEPPVVSCTDDKDSDCYKCAPKKFEQFLNQCPIKGSGCQGFDNAKLTSVKDGKLPDLP